METAAKVRWKNNENFRKNNYSNNKGKTNSKYIGERMDRAWQPSGHEGGAGVRKELTMTQSLSDFLREQLGIWPMASGNN